MIVLISGVAAPVAAATVPSPTFWKQDIPGARGDRLLTNLDGGVTAARCDFANTPIAAETFSSRGERLYTIPRFGADDRSCTRIAAVDRQGTTYGFNYTQDSIVAIKGGAESWKKAIGSPSCSGQLMPKWVDAGRDGFVYGLLSTNGCETTAWYLAKYKPQNGEVVFLKPASSMWRAAVTRAGIVAVTMGAISTYGYDGELRSRVNVSNFVDQNTYSISDDGAVYFVESEATTQAACPELAHPSKRLVGYDTTGEFYSRPLAACQRVQHLAVSSDKKLVFESTWATGTTRLAVVDGQTGAFVVERYFADQVADGRRFAGGVSLTADMKGNIVYVRALNTSSEGGNQYAQEYSLLSAKTLTLKQRFQTSSLSLASTQPWNIASALASGRLYVALDGDCGDSSCSRRLFGVSWPELGIDYPRGAILSDAPLEPTLTYVVLGDSYSSGEGVESGVDGPKFEPPSDENGCHRSYHAFGRQLDEALPDLRMQAGGFVACSGATVDSVRKGRNGEVSQLEALSPNTRVVSITVGGNDAEFDKFARACLFQSCSKTSDQYKASMALVKQTLPNKLGGLYKEILQRAPNAKLYVLGYPQLLPDKGLFQNPCVFVPENLRGKIDAEDHEGARSLVVELNNAIRFKVNELKRSPELADRVVYIDPEADFIGHELCRQDITEEYFYQPMQPEIYTFHPKKVGQTAYMEALLPYVS